MMPKCKKCGKDFVQRQIINGRERNLRNRVFCLECVPFSQHKTDVKRDEPNEQFCLNCGVQLTGIKRKYCENCVEGTNRNAVLVQQQRAKERKFELIQMLGGCCQKCGYKRNAAALTFHHLRDKSFPMDVRNIANRSWDLVLAEAKKCELLCLNCHMEHHYQPEEN